MQPKAILLAFFTVAIVFSQATAQMAPDIQWKKCLGGSNKDYARCIRQTTDGGLVVAGYSRSNDGDVSGNHGGLDAWIVKLDLFLNIEWQKSLGGTGLDYAYIIRQTTDGGYVVAGSSWSNDGDVTGNHGLGDIWIVKLNPSGNIEWQKCLGGSNYDWGHSIQQTTDGGYVVAGESSSNNGDVSGNHGSRDFWIVKLDLSGNIEWQKSLGGSHKDIARCIQQTADGGYVVAGESESNDGDVSGNHGSRDYWIVKLDPSGNIEWQKCLGGSLADGAWSIGQTTDKGFVVAGSSHSNNGDVSGNHGAGDYWIVRLDLAGNIIWQKCLGGSNFEWVRSIQQTTDEGFIVSGRSKSKDGNVTENQGSTDYWVVKLDDSGIILWQKSMGGTGADEAKFIQQTADGGFVVAGCAGSNDGDVEGNQGQYDYWIVKLAWDCDLPVSHTTSDITPTSANLKWTEVAGAEGYNVIYKEMGAGSWQQTITSSTSKKISGLSPNTDYLWAMNTVCSITPEVTSAWSAEQYFTTLPQKQAAEMTSTFELSLFPNPAKGNLTIEVTTAEPQSLSIKFFDLPGREVYSGEEQTINGTITMQLGLNPFPPGTYMLHVQHGETRETRKVVVE